MEKETLKGPKPEAPKVPPPKPEIQGETIFIGKGEPVEEKPKEAKPTPKAEASKKPTGEAKTAEIHAKIVIEQAMEKDPLVRQAFTERPIKDPRVEEFVAERLEAGRKLADIGHDLENALKYKKVEVTGSALGTLAEIETVTGEKFSVLHIEAGAPTAVEDLFPASGTDLIITNPELVKVMQSIQKKLGITSLTSLGVHDTDIPATIKEIARGVDSGKWPQDQAEEAVKRIERVIKEIKEPEEKVDREQLERFSTIYLSNDERIALLDVDNAEVVVEEYLRRVEKSTIWAETTEAQSFEQRLTLMGQYFTHPQYIKEVGIHTRQEAIRYVNNPKNKTQFADQQSKDQYIDDRVAEQTKRGKDVADKLKEKVRYRHTLQQAYAMIRGTEDPDKIKGVMGRLGEAGIGFVLNENDGLVEIAFNKLINNLKLACKDPKTGQLRRYTPTLIKEIQRQTIDEMKRDRQIFEDAINEDLEKREIKRTVTISDEDCEANVNVARYIAVATSQDLVAILSGLSPSESGSEEVSTLARITAETFLGAMDINKFNIEKYMLFDKNPSLRVIWENDCRFATEASGRAEYIRERLDRILSKGKDPSANPDYTELLDELFGKGKLDLKVYPKNSNEAREALRKNANVIKKVLEYDADGHKRKNLPNDVSRLSRELLLDRLTVVEGEKVVGEILSMYDYYSSGWRQGGHYLQIKAIYGGGKDDAGYNLGLGFQLREKGAAVLSARKEEMQEAKDNLSKVLTKVEAFRPQTLFGFLCDHKYEPARGNAKGKGGWLDTANATGKSYRERFFGLFGSDVGTNPSDVRADTIIRAMNRRFIAINELLAIEGFPPIDYSRNTPLSQQMEVIQKVCGNMQTNANEYLLLMQEMSGFMTEHHGELLKEQYWGIYRRTQWIDDARLRYLEHPQEAKINGNKLANAEEILPFSQIIGEDGEGPSAPLPRYWNDMGRAMKAIGEVMKTFTMDPKTLKDSLRVINDEVTAYTGPPYGTRAVMYLLSGWGQTVSTDKLYDWLYLSGLDKSSPAKRLFGDKAPSMGLNEMEELFDEIGVTVLRSRMEELEPQMAQELQRAVGISMNVAGKWERKLPLHVYRARMLVAVLAILLALGTAKAAKGGVEGN